MTTRCCTWVLVLAAAVLAGCQIAPEIVSEAEPAQAPWVHDSDRLVVCHYFNWFKTPDGRGGWHNWQWMGKGPKHDPEDILEDGRRDIASVYYPMIGPYDSFDPIVIECHMLSALAAKIDGFFIDWYGMPSDEEKGFRMLLDMAGKLGFKMCICFEDKAMFGYYYHAKDREEAIRNAVENMKYILETHAAHPAYLHIDGKPVIINFSWTEPSGDVDSQGFSAAEYERILSTVREEYEVYFVHDYHCHIREEYWAVSDNVYPWVDVNGPCLDRFYEEVQARRASDDIGFVTSLVYPGFDNTGVWGWGDGPVVTPREDGAFYARLWERALANNVRFLQIATWNDFGEGASIEPAMQYGFQYLELTEQFASRLKGQPSDGARGAAVAYGMYAARKAVEGLDESDPDTAADLGDRLDGARQDYLGGRFEAASLAAASVLAGARERIQRP